MLNLMPRLYALFGRYAAHHLRVSSAGNPLLDATGTQIGNLDLIEVQGERLRIAGWAVATQVALRCGDGLVSTRPLLLRQDVADVLGLGPAVGFDLQVMLDPAPARLIVTLGEGQHIIQPLPLPQTGPARRALRWRFGLILLRAVPTLILWRLTYDPRHRATLRRLFNLGGLPVAARLLQADIFAAPAPGPAPLPRPITIIVPVFNAFELLADMLDRIRRHTDLPWHLLLIEDCSTDPRVRPFLRDWVGQYGETRVSLIENPQNLGFIGSVNSGLGRALTLGHDVVLLNSDALVPAGWASRLLRPLWAETQVASVTPLSNDAEIYSSPALCRRVVLDAGQADAMDAVAARFNPDIPLPETPTGVGFCMAMSIAYLRQVPQLDTVFGRGYGEEVDWCQKTRALGGRHLALPGLFVEHRGGESFGSDAKRKLIGQNGEVISTRYPEYDADVQRFIAADPLLTPRLALALAWAATCLDPDGRPHLVPVYLAHSLGGGAEKYLEKRIADDLAATGRPAVILRVGGPVRWQIEVVGAFGTTAGATDDFDLVARLIGLLARREIVCSCAVGDPDPMALPGHLLALKTSAGDQSDVEIEVLFHDYYALSPSYTLLDAQGIYHGPLTAAVAADRAHSTRRPDGTPVSLTDWQAAWGALIQAADRLVVFSNDSRMQVATAYPAAQHKLVLRPHQMQAQVPVVERLVERAAGSRRVVAVLGNIGRPKGAGVLCELGRLLPADGSLGLVLIGNIDPAYALPGSVPVHGDYQVAEIPALVARYGITDWLIPSICPETFSYTTREALATGLPVYAFGIGAQGEVVAEAANGNAIPFQPLGGAAFERHLAQDILHSVTTTLDAKPALIHHA